MALVMLIAATAAIGPPLATPASSAGVDHAAGSYAKAVVERGYLTTFGTRIDARSRAYWYPRVLAKGSATWFASALTNTALFRREMASLPTDAFLARVYRNAGVTLAEGERTWWTLAFRGGADRATVIAWVIEHGFGRSLARPRATSPCRRFDRPGPVTPWCDGGSPGRQVDVTILKVPNTNLFVNRAWYVDVDAFIRAARSAGYDLQAERHPSMPSWMLAPGSWRSWADQEWLHSHGFPANPPGRSMHEWGLAIDFVCDGKLINEYRACWNWARTTGPRYNVRLFSRATTSKHPEAGHFSANGT